ncbi:MAG: hypothetical protein QNJ77_05415 [Acidimicrobiia bacterium]|nr:hypothetical protein [Acidimicrobiia bacterium]
MDTEAFASIFRWIHISAGAAWLGAVVTVVFVLIPAAVQAEVERRRWFLANVFPRIFRLASVVSLTVVIAGAALWLASNDWSLNLGALFDSRYGLSILIGGTLGLALTVFHFVAESRLQPMVASIGRGELDDREVVHFLRIVPRVGLGVLLAAFGAMMYAAHGF